MYSKHHEKKALLQERRGTGRGRHHKHGKGCGHGHRSRDGHPHIEKGGWFHTKQRPYTPDVHQGKDQGYEAQGTNACPICEKHCSLDAPGCPRGEAFVLSPHLHSREDGVNDGTIRPAGF